MQYLCSDFKSCLPESLLWDSLVVTGMVVVSLSFSVTVVDESSFESVHAKMYYIIVVILLLAMDYHCH